MCRTGRCVSGEAGVPDVRLAASCECNSGCSLCAVASGGPELCEPAAEYFNFSLAAIKESLLCYENTFS